MAGIDPSLASHKLNIIASAKPVRQKIIHYLPKSSLDYLDGSRQSSKSRFYQGGKVILDGLPTWWSSQRMVLNGEYVWTTRTLMKLVQRIASPYRE